MSLLHAAGLGELVGGDPEGYVRIAGALGADGPRRTALRASLRRRVADSALRDERGFVGRLESACRNLWRARCASTRGCQ